jgi:opacity protein-like surface antigen
MRKLVTFLMALVIGSSLSYANAEMAQINFEAGYRHDDIRWSYRAPSCDPIFETTHRFKDLNIFQIGICAKTHLGCNWYGRASARWGWILEGDIEEKFTIFASLPEFSDFEALQFDDRRHNIVDGRYTADLDIAIGYPFYFCDCSLSLAPVIGYAYDVQNIRIEGFNGVDIAFSDEFIDISSQDCCCDSKFINRWYGPFVGLDFDYKAGECFDIYAAFEYHWAYFKGKRQTRSGFDFSDDLEGRSRHADGWVVKVGVEYELCNCWTIGLCADWKDFRAHKRHRQCNSEFSSFASDVGDIAVLSDIDSEFRVRSRHKWNSYSINLTLGYMF